MLNLTGFGFASRFGVEVSAIAVTAIARGYYFQCQVDFVLVPATAVRRRRPIFSLASVVVRQRQRAMRSHQIRAGPSSASQRRPASADLCRVAGRALTLVSQTFASRLNQTTRPTALFGGSFALHYASFDSFTS